MEENPDYVFPIVKLIITFLLTSVFGTVIATYFQDRIWKHQQNERIREEERSKALEIFDEISKLLDQRLYRYRQILYAFRSKKEERISRAFSEYRDVLFEWNDNLNRNYSRIEIYFGINSRRKLEDDIAKDLIYIGYLLECKKKDIESGPSLDEIRKKIDHLNAAVYGFDRSLLELIDGPKYRLPFTQPRS